MFRLPRLALVVSAWFLLLGSGSLQAEPARPARCCEKAEEKGETCRHECCVEAARRGRHCERCGGVNESEERPSSPPPPPKKSR